MYHIIEFNPMICILGDILENLIISGQLFIKVDK